MPFSLAQLGHFAATDVSQGVPFSYWVIFCIAVAILLILDMTVFHRKSHEPTLRESAVWTVFWTSLALGFCIWVEIEWGRRAALQFLTGYLVEWSLSMDNVFVFAIIFSYFHIPLKHQYRILFWGILGAIMMRLTFILAAGKLFEHFEWLFVVFGLFLIYTGIKLAISHEKKADPAKNFILRLARKYLRVAEGEHGDRFFIRQNGRIYATTAFLVLLVVESTDVLFAVDSVPAIFGVVDAGPQRFFIVFTSNVFAIMGLRALYFLLAGIMNMFRYLNYGLSGVLCFIGLKMIVKVWFHWEVLPVTSLVIVAMLLGTSILASVVVGRRDASKLQK
ncbi:MAG: TerC family protein [Pirellulales bacterium]|nr:TerC family protein [Pirellulales bacterium]